MKKIFSFLAVCFAAVVLLASCDKKYTVEFDVDGGSEVASVKVVEGEVLENQMHLRRMNTLSVVGI